MDFGLGLVIILFVLGLAALSSAYAQYEASKAREQVTKLATTIAGLKGQIEYENLNLSNMTTRHMQNALRQYSQAIRQLSNNNLKKAKLSAEAGLLEASFARKLIEGEIVENTLGEGNCLDLDEIKPEPIITPPKKDARVMKAPYSHTKVEVINSGDAQTCAKIMDMLKEYNLPVDDCLFKAMDSFADAAKVNTKKTSYFTFNLQVGTTQQSRQTIIKQSSKDIDP
jgi:hypothetical protein